MMTKQIPVHAELIKQWAEGAIIQWYNPDGVGLDMRWQDCNNNLPSWLPNFKYRIKPEPKPDDIRYAYLDKNESGNVKVISNFFTRNRCPRDNLIVVFDGETGALKSAEVINDR